MNIAFVSNVVYPFVKGGAEKRIYEIGTRLAKEGHDITVYGRHFWKGPSEMDHDGLRLCAVAPETDIYEGDRRSISEAVDFSVRVTGPLHQGIKNHGHNLVVASVFPYFPVLSSKLATLGTEIPLVTTWHEVWGNYWREYLGRLAPFGKVTERVTANTPQYPIAVSESTADRLAEMGPNRDSIKTVPNGIDTTQIQNAPLPDRRYDLLFAGRLIEHKNVDILLDAFDAIANEYDIMLGILGDGPEMSALKDQCLSLSNSERIDFLGFLEDYEQVLGHMRSANIFVSPSTREGFGITFVEAMAAGCIVIGADHPGSAVDSVINDAGFLAEPTVDDLKRTLIQALNGKRPASDPINRAMKFDWDSVARQAESAYKCAVDGKW